MSLTHEQARLIEDAEKLKLIMQLLRDIDYDSVTEFLTTEDTRTDTAGKFLELQQQFRVWLKVAKRKVKVLYR